MSDIRKGYIQVYTGDGKGKTTAALGLAMRAAGAGLKVMIIQYMKGRQYSELFSIKQLPNITLEQHGSDRFCMIEDSNIIEHQQMARTAYERSMEVIRGQKYDLVILDEILVAAYLNLLDWHDIINLIDIKPQPLELVLTGRGARNEIIERADLVTEMKEIKHYYTSGVEARIGIEK